MPFPFSFSFAVPGIPNPFLSSSLPPAQAPPPSESESIRAIDKDEKPEVYGGRVGPVYRRAPSPCLLPPQPLSRKRGWVPSTSEPSQAATIPTSTSGYLDTPAKYRDMAPSHEEDELEEMVGDVPAPKRRRTLAGSIVSTALSAALIGTAVGLTVYRLWRNRGKQPQALPPPPYEQGEWVPTPEPFSREETPVLVPIPETKVTPATPRSKKPRYVAGRRTVPRHRKTPSKSQMYSHTPPRNLSPPRRAPIPAAFAGFDEAEAENDVDDPMDWMSDRLSKLIEEGKRALGTEVVVMSESKEDEVDDGSGAWVEDEPLPTSSSASFSSRRGRKRPQNLPLPSFSPPAYAHTPSASPRKGAFDADYRYAPESPRKSLRGPSVDSMRSFRTLSPQAEEDTTMSSELKESMERARMLYRQRNQQS
ncbi:hypothetical protein QCA50_008963 [Cerrena zonata]|uniref:Uncharacterized protein n=1 Tax=Cerrena zonata TaxID=2478898 RepID=A0AAW0GFG5_9APHY